MNIAKVSTLAMAVALTVNTTAQANDQSVSKGFVEDGKLTSAYRNYYWYHDGKNGGGDGSDWSQALLNTYTSGFTTGTVGFGLDAYANVAMKLDARKNGASNVPIQQDGDFTDYWTHAGAAVKLRVSNTVFKYGSQSIENPVFGVGGSRIQPAMATGLSVQSKEIENLMLEAGHFTSATGFRGQSTHEPISTTYIGPNAIEVKKADYVGGTYQALDNLTLSLYTSKYEDVWNQYYGGATYILPLADTQKLVLDLNAYRTTDTGSAKAGDIDTTAYSLSAGYIVGAQKFTVAYQKVHGDTPFDYLAIGEDYSPGDAIWLANSVHASDFNGPGESSWQVRYDLNMSTLGVPGLSFMTRYITGTGVDGSHTPANSLYGNYNGATDASEHELDVEAKYVVQSGPAKDLSFRLRQAFYRADSAVNTMMGPDTNQTRLMMEYPLNLF